MATIIAPTPVFLDTPITEVTLDATVLVSFAVVILTAATYAFNRHE